MKKYLLRIIKLVALPIVLISYAAFSAGCTTLHTENDKLSYATGYFIARWHVESENGLFWFHKGKTPSDMPDISECNFDTIASSLRSGLEGRPRMTLREANLKIHDFRGDNDAGRPINLDSMSIVYGTLLHWQKFRFELLQFEPNIDLLIRGLHDGITSVGNPLIDKQTINDLFDSYFQIQMPERNMVETQKFLAEIETEIPGVQRTESGLLYRIDNPGNGLRITSDDDVCEANYNQDILFGGISRGTTSWSYKIGQPFNSIRYPEFREALKLIGVGGKIVIWTNTGIFYDQDIFNTQTTPNMPVASEFELISVRPDADFK